MGHELQVYRKLSEYPLYIIAAICSAVAILPLIYSEVRKYNSKSYSTREHLFEDFMFKVSKVILLKEFEQKTDSETGEKKYYFRGHHIPMKSLTGILLLSHQFVYVIIMLAIITFWTIFLTEETFACDPGLDCFPFAENGSNLQDNPIVNCSDFASADNITFICYRFVFQFVEGIGAAIGMMAFSALVVTAYTAILFCTASLLVPKNEDGDSDCDLCTSRVRCISFYLIALSPGVMGLILLVVFTQVTLLKDMFLKSFISSVQFVAYLVSFNYISVFAGFVLARLVYKYPSAKSDGSVSRSAV